MQRESDKGTEVVETMEDDATVGTEEKVNGKNTLPECYKRKDYIDAGGADW